MREAAREADSWDADWRPGLRPLVRVGGREGSRAGASSGLSSSGLAVEESSCAAAERMASASWVEESVLGLVEGAREAGAPESVCQLEDLVLRNSAEEDDTGMDELGWWVRVDEGVRLEGGGWKGEMYLLLDRPRLRAASRRFSSLGCHRLR